ncbi:MAG: DUF4349 domain-containing protein [Nanoarchaeota archaeon]
MGFSEQVKKLWDNWLIILIVIVVLLFMSGGSNLFSSVSNFGSSKAYYGQSESIAGDYAGTSYRNPIPTTNNNFAPEVSDRKIVKSGSLNLESKRGEFRETEQHMKNSVSAAGGFILSENVNTYTPDNSEKHSYTTGNYQIKIDASKYSSVVEELKDLGKVKSFQENSADITGSYTDQQVELSVEKDRLSRYETLYAMQSYSLQDKLSLTDKIFDQQRRIEYIQNSIKNLGQRVEYSTISLTISEKQSDFVNVVFVRITELISNFLRSLNALFVAASYILPWAIGGILIWLAFRFFKRKKVETVEPQLTKFKK